MSIPFDPDAEADRAVEVLTQANEALHAQRFDDAITLANEAAQVFVTVDGEHSPDGANALMTVADALARRARQDDVADAGRLFERALAMVTSHPADGGGPLDTLALRAQRGVGTAARLAARYADARAAFDAALARAERAFGPDSQAASEVCNDLGMLGKYTADFDMAARWYERALGIIERIAGPRSAAAATLHHNLAGLAHSRQRAGDGIASGRLSVEIRCELLGDDHPDVAADRANLGGLLMDVGETDEAEACFEAARVIFERVLGPEHFEVAVAWNNLAAVADARGDRRRAALLYRKALDLKTNSVGPSNPSTLVTAVNLAYATDDPREAKALFRRAIDGLSPIVGKDDRTLRAARQGLAGLR